MARGSVSSGVGRAVLALSVAGLVSLGAAAYAVGTTTHIATASTTPPSPVEGAEYSCDDDGFPDVDWEAWAEVNPDVVGWITVPGTEIDYPIAQAPADDPDHYLDHDVYGNRNAAGAVYLDAACAEDGLDGSKNALVCAHHINRGESAMFGPLAAFSDISHAASRTEVLLQTPTSKSVFEIVAVDVVAGSEAAVPVGFETQEELAGWIAETASEAAVVLSKPGSDVARCLTLATCSYNYTDDERTVVYAVEREDAIR